MGSKQGVLMLDLKEKTNFVQAGSRALNEADYKNTDNYTVIVTDKNGAEKLNCKGGELANNMPLVMDIGAYSVKAFYGKESTASRDNFYVYGETKGTIVADQSQSVTVDCVPTCGKLIVNFGSAMSTYFLDYNVVFSGTEALGGGELSWKKSDTEPWYVKLNETEETISFTISTTARSEYLNGSNNAQEATKTGTFKLSRNKAYKMNINPSYTPTTDGSLDITITIDESTNDKEVDIEVPVDWI